MLFSQNFSIGYLVMNALVLLISMAVHEAAHCYVADWMGDPTPRSLGRLTLNPLVHIYWFGWLMWVFVGFGILGSAPIDQKRMRNPRVGGLLAVAAGPFSNLALAILSGIPFMLGWLDPSLPGARSFIPTLAQFMTGMVILNVLLFVFNLLPFFPLDGWHIVRNLLPPDLGYTWVRYQREMYMVFWGLIILSILGQGQFDILGWIINPPRDFLIGILLRPLV